MSNLEEHWLVKSNLHHPWGGGEFPSKEEKRKITRELKLCILELERWLSG